MRRVAWMAVFGALAACGPRSLGTLPSSVDARDGGHDTAVDSGHEAGGSVDRPVEAPDATDAPDADADRDAPIDAPTDAPADAASDAADGPTWRRPPQLLTWEPHAANDLPRAVITATAATGQYDSIVVLGTLDGRVYQSAGYGDDGPVWRRLDDRPDGGTARRLPALPVTSVLLPPTQFGSDIYVAFSGAGAGPKIFHTVDGGGTWQALGDAATLGTADVWSLSQSPLEPARLYAYTSAGVRYSADRGVTWSADDDGDLLLPSTRVTGITCASGGNSELFVGTATGYVLRTTDIAAGAWSAINRSPMPGRPITRVTRVKLPHEANPNDVAGVFVTFAGLAEDNVWYSTNNGINWENRHLPDLPTADPVDPNRALYGLSYNPQYPTTLYLIASDGAHISDNSGLTWHQP